MTILYNKNRNLSIVWKGAKLNVIMADISDEKLVEQYLKGDEEALAFLIHKYTSPIYNFTAQIVGRGQNAEDITQETFIKAWKSLKRFDVNKKFKTWLFYIAKNTAIDYLRKRKIATVDLNIDVGEDEEDGVEKLADPAILPFENLVLQEQAEIVQKAVDGLPEIYRAVLNLYYQEQLSLPEIAEVFKEPVDTIKSRHRRALLKLKELLISAP